MSLVFRIDSFNPILRMVDDHTKFVITKSETSSDSVSKHGYLNGIHIKCILHNGEKGLKTEKRVNALWFDKETVWSKAVIYFVKL